MQLLGVLEARIDQCCGIRIIHGIFHEKGIGVPSVAVDDMSDERTEKDDVCACAYLHMNIAQCRSACKTRVDMHQDCTVVGLGLERLAEGNGMALGHVRTHYQDCIGVYEIARKGC